MSSGRADLDVVAEALAVLPPPQHGWTDELYDLYDRFRREPEPALPPEHRQRFEQQRKRERLSSAAHEALWSLMKRVEGAALGAAAIRAEAAELAERCVRARFVAQDAVSLLHALGRPVGEEVLLRLVRDPSVDEYDRAWAREWLIRMRRPDYEARARESLEGEEPLLPEAVRELPVSPHGGGVEWPEDADRVRRVLEVLLPAERLARPEPPADWHRDDEGEEVDYSERPEWCDVDLVRRSVMPHPSLVTRERMAELRRECELLGLDVAAEGFTERWVTRIRAWLAGAALDRVGRCFDGPKVVPWAMDLAQRYVERDAAAEDAVTMLIFMNDVSYSREALTRLAADASLQLEVRSRIEDALR
ncbi:hypothetical protein ACFC0D_19305 [Streptomyces sp. NPDC056222]|uniref:hypothetical protein n=1 Tax=Streptomyces sp. NPDC056222 TaxID=3345749 RepID=UPI0035DD35D5